MSVRALVFDLTDVFVFLAKNSTITGVHRVVINLIQDALCQHDCIEIYGVCYSTISGRYEYIDIAFMEHEFPLDRMRDLLPAREVFRLRTQLILKRHEHDPARWWFHRVRRSIRELLTFGPNAASVAVSVVGPVPGPDVAVVSLGAGWESLYDKLIEFAQTGGMSFVPFIHDVIPIVRPDFTTSSKPFADFFAAVSAASVGLLTNSRHSRDDIERVLKELTIQRPVSVVEFPHEYKSSESDTPSELRQAVLTLGEQPFALCPGTIEIRKNCTALLAAWRRLADQGIKLPKLVFAGKKGWLIAEFEAEWQRATGAGIDLEIVERPTDAELKRLYETCAFTVYPSLYEGWGLPVGESLWFGKPVICANISSLPEVGREFAVYFDPDREEALDDAIRKVLSGHGRLPDTIRESLTTWAETGRSLVNGINGILDTRSNEQSRSSLKP